MPAASVDRRTFLEQAALLVTGSATGLLAQSAAPAVALPVFYNPTSQQHRPSGNHPESPVRLDIVMGVVHELERTGRFVVQRPRVATDAEIARVHDPGYMALVAREIAERRSTLSTGDTDVSPGSLEAARAAAGAVVSAVDAVMAGPVRRAFCAVRPPGHHASQARGMGFCLFNNIAIGARHAQRRHGVSRVAIVDWDVHHGNGTQAVFWADGSVLLFDTHQHPWYPGTGKADEEGSGRGRGLIINRPLPATSGREAVLGAFREGLLPAADRFKPELVMIAAGFDSRLGDPLGQFRLTEQDFRDLTDMVREVANVHAGGRVVSVLEGGYASKGLDAAARAHLERL